VAGWLAYRIPVVSLRKHDDCFFRSACGVGLIRAGLARTTPGVVRLAITEICRATVVHAGIASRFSSRQPGRHGHGTGVPLPDTSFAVTEPATFPTALPTPYSSTRSQAARR
jgi:hypothetical protein